MTLLLVLAAASLPSLALVGLACWAWHLICEHYEQQERDYWREYAQRVARDEMQVTR